MGRKMLNNSESSGNIKSYHKLNLVKNESEGRKTASLFTLTNEQCEGEVKAR